MIKLTPQNSKADEVFYFNNVEDLQIFKDVLRDHWVVILWNEPIEKPRFKEMELYDFAMLGKPKELAIDNLSWAICNEDPRTEEMTIEAFNALGIF